MNIDALLEDYMNNPKWAGKIFMQDEKTCYIDGLIAGAKAMREENEQLNYIQHSIELQKQKQEMECNKMSSTIIEELKNKNEQLKAQIEKMKCCQNCSYFLLRLLENEVYVHYCCENDKYLTTEKVCNKWRWQNDRRT